MTLSPIWRTRFFAAGGVILAVWLGADLAYGEFLWPALVTGGLALFLLAFWLPLSLDAFLIGLATIGYVVGNRGFAQISLTSRLPLLPGETILLVCGVLLLVRSARRRELPLRPDPLNLAILAWIILGTLRIYFDVRRYGFVALRDFALVYYAAYFFIGQELARDKRNRRFYENVLLIGCVLLLPVYLLLDRFPMFFLTRITLRGEPLIYLKADLAGTFMVVGSTLAFLRFEQRGSGWLVALSLALAGGAMTLSNRATALALLVAALWLAVGGRRRFAATLGATGVLATIAILAGASVLRIPWEKTPVYGIYEEALSVTDPTGQRTYTGAETFNKGDNNLFRWVWWQAVLDETLDTNPYTGVGFGADLAARFVQEYYPENDEFDVRSPHNVVLTIFARMGAVGLLAFLVVIGVIGVQTWRAIRIGPDEAALWCAVWAILTSACLGVVLEGPMGAVVFWTALGLAHGSLQRRRAELAAPAEPATAETAPEVAATAVD